jgi:hypothetical protein
MKLIRLGHAWDQQEIYATSDLENFVGTDYLETTGEYSLKIVMMNLPVVQHQTMGDEVLSTTEHQRADHPRHKTTVIQAHDGKQTEVDQTRDGTGTD